MANIHLYSNFNNADTRVSNKFIDEYMVDANGEFVKIYLYLLRCIGAGNFECSISAIADRFCHTEADTIRAIKYWEKQGLINVSYGASEEILGLELISLDFLCTSEQPAVNAVSVAPTNVANANVASATNVAPVNVANAVSATSLENIESATSNAASVEAVQLAAVQTATTVPEKKEYTLDEIKNFRKDPDISELFFILEVYLKHPLSSSDINTILYWYDELSFHADLIVYLVEYCLSKNHSSIKYMDKVALNWAEHNITTVEQAKENCAAHSQIYYAVMKALGISGRNLVASEQEFLRKWTKDYLFDNEIIEEACRRTITATHQPSFEYTDTILTNWHKNQVHTLNDIKRLDEVFSKNKKVTVTTTDKPTTKRNKFNYFEQRNHDFDQLEKVLLTTSVQ